VLYLGDAAPGPVTLSVAAPPAPLPTEGGAPFTPTEALTAEIRVQLWRTDGDGTVLVQEGTDLGTVTEQQATRAGACHVEVWVKPRHLTIALGTSAELADREYRRLITTRIVVSS
jgi:hypothetical protein